MATRCRPNVESDKKDLPRRSLPGNKLAWQAELGPKQYDQRHRAEKNLK